MSILFSPVTILNALAALEPCEVTSEIAYGEGPRRKLDVYQPSDAHTDLPVVVFFYGGGWEEGERSDYRFVGAALASRGIVTVIPDYRIYPQVRFPAFLEDGAAAVRWAREHAAQFGGDPGRIVLVGHSAGAHIAAMLTFDRQWLAGVGLDATRDLAGMVGIAGPYDFLPLRSDRLKDIFGPEPGRALSQPINFVAGGEVPVLLVTGRKDGVVDPGNALRLAARIHAHGGSAQTQTYALVGHPTIIGAFGAPLRPLAPVLADTVEFIASVTGPRRDGRGA